VTEKSKSEIRKTSSTGFWIRASKKIPGAYRDKIRPEAIPAAREK
jgi:hypothetical protein